MSNLVVLGITGHNGVGKDLVASSLSLLGGFFRIGLADGVRASLNDLDGVTWQFRKESDGAGPIARNAMKLMGSEARNDIGCPLLWTDLVLAKIQYAYRYHAVSRNRFVIPDMRFPHEQERISSWVAEKGGFFETIKISRPGFFATSYHESETNIDKIKPDFEINNCYDRNHLIDVIKIYVKHHKWL